MSFPEFLHQILGCKTVAYFPASCMECFSKRGNDKTPVGQIGKPGSALMLKTIKNDVFVNFITQENNIGISDNFFQLHEVIFF